jgi:hypothetical protein
MMAAAAFRGRLERLGTNIYLLWAGLAVGVAFLATPAKFLAPSLSLPVALDVGHHTFQVYNSVEVALIVSLLIAGGGSTSRRRWYLCLLAPGLVVVAQAFWLIPALDVRVAAIQAGRSHLPPSVLHRLYITAEALKLLWLLAVGWGQMLSASPERGSGRGPRAERTDLIQAKWNL